MSKETLAQAIEMAGGQAHLARGIRDRITGSKIGQVHVWGWLNSVQMEVPPPETVIPICDFLGWRMTPHGLRPDLYPNPTDALPVSEIEKIGAGDTPAPAPGQCLIEKIKSSQRNFGELPDGSPDPSKIGAGDAPPAVQPEREAA